MYLKTTFVDRSPLAQDRVRLSGEVVFENNARSEIIWFDVPQQYQSELSVSGNPWLICLLPASLQFGERIRIELPVDQMLYHNIAELVRIWHNWGWWKDAPAPVVEAPLKDDFLPNGVTPATTAVSFSGGVDSLFTALHPGSGVTIDELLFIRGYDIPLDSPDIFCGIRSRLEAAAESMGKNLVDVATNVKITALQGISWMRAHGIFLGSVALALEGRYGKILAGSAFDQASLRPWGTSPETMPLMSTKHLQFAEHGTAFNRFQKTEMLAGSEVALQSLIVCQFLKSDKNCGKCEKCLRTMVTLDAIGVLDRCTVFDKSYYSLEKIRMMYHPEQRLSMYLLEIRDGARRFGRLDIVEAADYCIRRSTRIRRLSSVAYRILPLALARAAKSTFKKIF